MLFTGKVAPLRGERFKGVTGVLELKEMDVGVS